MYEVNYNRRTSIYEQLFLLLYSIGRRCDLLAKFLVQSCSGFCDCSCKVCTINEEEEDFAKTAKVRCEGAHLLLAL